MILCYSLPFYIYYPGLSVKLLLSDWRECGIIVHERRPLPEIVPGNPMRTDYRRDILDVKQGVAVSFLVVNENDNPVMFVMRLKVADKKITEVETMVVRNRLGVTDS